MNNKHQAIIKRVLEQLEKIKNEVEKVKNELQEEYDELSKPNIQNAFEEVQAFIEEAVNCGFDVTATMVSGFTEGKPDIEAGRKIAEDLGAKFRVREFITNGY